MSAIQFIGTTPADLVHEIKNAIIPELKEELSREFQPKQPTEYLTRTEVCKLLKIDLSTLHRWTKSGKLNAYGIGNRVYYKRSEIESYLEINKLKLQGTSQVDHQKQNIPCIRIITSCYNLIGSTEIRELFGTSNFNFSYKNITGDTSTMYEIFFNE